MEELEELIISDVMKWGKIDFNNQEVDYLSECECNDKTCQDCESERQDWCKSEW